MTVFHLKHYLKYFQKGRLSPIPVGSSLWQILQTIAVAFWWFWQNENNLSEIHKGFVQKKHESDKHPGYFLISMFVMVKSSKLILSPGRRLEHLKLRGAPDGGKKASIERQPLDLPLCCILLFVKIHRTNVMRPDQAEWAQGYSKPTQRNIFMFLSSFKASYPWAIRGKWIRTPENGLSFSISFYWISMSKAALKSNKVHGYLHYQAFGETYLTKVKILFLIYQSCIPQEGINTSARRWEGRGWVAERKWRNGRELHTPGSSTKELFVCECGTRG